VDYDAEKSKKLLEDQRRFDGLKMLACIVEELVVDGQKIFGIRKGRSRVIVMRRSFVASVQVPTLLRQARDDESRYSRMRWVAYPRRNDD
jgi:hypothetical protein